MILYTEQKKQWLRLFSKLPLDKQYEMFIDLLDQNVSDEELIKDDIGSIAVDLKSNLIHNKEYEKAIHLIEMIKEATGTFYQKEFPYLSNFAVEYYLYKNDSDKLHDHLQAFIANPVAGYDMFIPLFDKIMFSQKNQLALKMAEKIYEPVKTSSSLIRGAESEIIDIIFYNAFQEFFLAEEKNPGAADTQQLASLLKKYDYKDSFFEELFPGLVQTLTGIATGDKEYRITSDSWRKMVQNNSEDASYSFYWSFAVYMLKTRNIHFSISANIWFPYFVMISRAKQLTSFRFTFDNLNDLTDEYFGFLSNQEEKAYAVTWGIPYIYDFLSNQGLIDADIYEESQKHVNAVKKDLIKIHEDDLWSFDFVHAWGKPLSIDDAAWKEEIDLFHHSFIDRDRKKPAVSEDISNSFNQLSLFDDLLDDRKNNKTKKATPSKAAKKNKKKQAKKQRQKNRKK